MSSYKPYGKLIAVFKKNSHGSEHGLMDRTLEIYETKRGLRGDLWYSGTIGQSEANEEEKSWSLQIQAYLTTASDELYAPGKRLYTKEHHEGIHECMKMWQKLHRYYFSTRKTNHEPFLRAHFYHKDNDATVYRVKEYFGFTGPNVLEVKI